MTDENDETDERLARLTRATEGVAPRANFNARAMAAVKAEHDGFGWWSDMPRIAWRVVPIAAVIATLTVVWTWHASSDAEDALVGSFDSMEVDW